MNWHRLLASLAYILIGCTQAGAPSPQQSSHERISEVRYVMGTLLDLTIYAPTPEGGRTILNDTFAVAEHLDTVLSTWKPESPVSVFNRSRTLPPRTVDEALYDVVATSHRLSQLTDGAFTIGVRPLVELWERAAKRGAAPSQAEVERVRRLIAPDAFTIVPPSQIGKRDAAAMIETGGIGKGYAVDRMVELLRSRGIRNAFINFGRSSIAALGAPPRAAGWSVEVALTEGSSEGTITLRDETLSVSRARGNPFLVNGVAYAHVFDPSTGMPVKTSRGAAVRGPSATDGEAFVKYLVIRGTPSPTISTQWGSAQWIVREGDGVELSESFLK